MRTIESVVKQVEQIVGACDSICGYDPGAPVGIIPPNEYKKDSPVRCSLGAIWHLKAGKPPHHMMLQSCDRHFAMCVKLLHDIDVEPEVHEFGSACGLPTVVAKPERTTCASQAKMFELGLLTTLVSQLESPEDSNRCDCRCPACQPWMHLKGECDTAIDVMGYTHMQYMRLTMGAEIN